jgi:hypothetical protein
MTKPGSIEGYGDQRTHYCERVLVTLLRRLDAWPSSPSVGNAPTPIATVAPAGLLREPRRGHDGDHRQLRSEASEHRAMRWVIYFYFVLPKAARPIYVAIWLFFIAALVSDGAGH